MLMSSRLNFEGGKKEKDKRKKKERAKKKKKKRRCMGRKSGEKINGKKTKLKMVVSALLAQIFTPHTGRYE